ncbi:hypothetical protein B0T24DRAFT_19669 [Lasiosphaeria ovina]|uniref:Allergen Asp f 4 n=1 Tax=Lasiosphaeria ovina TaxID=92902 RepID=A0AAE0NJE2_9PEZI|nr:hypothetical protein B0T24DRAFT_19669 [Lasiosphaeria ovina]
MQLSHFLFVAGAIGAAAHPSGHHVHRSAHLKQRDALEFVKTVHTTEAADPPAAAPAPSASPAVLKESAAPAPSPSAPAAPAYTPFCGANAKVKRATLGQILYEGNTGKASGCKWGSNLMVVDNSIADKYDRVMTYTNHDSVPYQVICANKIGPDGAMTPMFPTDGELNFSVAPGQTKTVVADINSQGTCAFAPNEIPKAENGQYAGLWIEFDVGNTSNGGWSGADCSALVAQHYGLPVPTGSVCNFGTTYCSHMLPGGTGDNAYTKGMEAEDGVGLNLNSPKVHLEISMGQY